MTKLEKFMQENNWTKEELANKVKHSNDSVRRFMEVGLVKHDISVKFAKALNCKVSYIKED